MEKKMYQGIVLLFCLCAGMWLNAQEAVSPSLLETAVTRLDTVTTVSGWKEVRQDFERLYAAESPGWLPAYYLAYTDITLLFLSSDPVEKEGYKEEAGTCLEQLERMELPDEAARSETSTLKGYWYYARVALDPAVNGPKYAGLITACFAEALRRNPANPRALSLNASFQRHMATFLHRKYEAYEAEMERAARLFEAQSRSGVMPRWGNRTH